MSAVEQARAAREEAERVLFAVACMDAELNFHESQVEDADRAINAYRAAVRAERDAAWREGMEAAIAKVPRFRMVRQVKSATGYSVQMTHHDERKHKNEPKCVYGPDVVAALAALAARMEAK